MKIIAPMIGKNIRFGFKFNNQSTTTKFKCLQIFKNRYIVMITGIYREN